MRKQLKKAAALGAVAFTASAMIGCMGYGYGSSSYYSSTRNQVKTTEARENLDEFDIASLKQEDGRYQLDGLPWGSTQAEFEELLGTTVSSTVAFTDGGGYADLNYSILLLDKVSLGMMPVFDEDGGIRSLSFYFENIYTAEQLDSFYTDLINACSAQFGEPDEVRPEERETNGTKFSTETCFWYYEVSPTEMTTLQVAKTDTGSGTEAVIMGINNYNPEEIEQESVEETESEEETK